MGSFCAEILKKGEHWVWTVVKNGVNRCRICKKKKKKKKKKKGDIIQVDDRDYRSTYGSAPPGRGTY